MRLISRYIFKKGYKLTLVNEYGKVVRNIYVSFKRGSINLPKLTKPHHIFEGWGYLPDGPNPELFLTTEKINRNREAKVTLYAAFKKEKVYVTYYGRDVSGAMNDTVAEYGDRITLTENNYVRSGYLFRGWATEENSRDVVFDDKQTLVIRRDYALYPVWYSYKIKYVYEFRGKKYEEIEYLRKGEQFTIKSDISFDNWELVGWDVRRDAKTPMFIANGKYIDIISEGEIVLEAIWIIKDNVIIFNGNKGFGSMRRVVTKDNSIRLPENKFYRSGYKFIGWATSAGSNKIKYNNNAEFVFKTQGAQIRLFAVWDFKFNEAHFDIRPHMSKAEKLAILDRNYELLSRRRTSNNPEIIAEAEEAIKSILALRTAINEGE